MPEASEENIDFPASTLLFVIAYFSIFFFWIIQLAGEVRPRPAVTYL